MHLPSNIAAFLFAQRLDPRCERTHSLTRIADFIFRLFSLRLISLSAPESQQPSIDHYANHISYKTLLRSRLVNLDLVQVLQLVAVGHELTHRRKACRVGSQQKVTEASSQDFVGAGMPVHAGHRVVTFGEIPMLIKEGNLFLGGQRYIDRLLDFKAPDSFRAISDKRTVTLFTLAQGLSAAFAMSDILNHRQTVKRLVTWSSDNDSGQVKPNRITLLRERTSFTSIAWELATEEFFHELLINEWDTLMHDRRDGLRQKFLRVTVERLAKRLVDLPEPAILIKDCH